ncbi:mCG1035981 [Mus musculus]|nr:mCG1035981 [Mus musculus]
MNKQLQRARNERQINSCFKIDYKALPPSTFYYSISQNHYLYSTAFHDDIKMNFVPYGKCYKYAQGKFLFFQK